MSSSFSEGYIYIMENPLMRGLYKIGFSKSPEARLKQHSKTSLAERYECIMAYPVLNMRKAERLVFSLLDDYRYATNREFFECPLDLVITVCNDVQRHINMNKPLSSSFITEDIIEKLEDRFTYIGE